MRINVHCLFVFFLLTSNAQAERKFNFSTRTFQLGEWSPTSLSYEQGLKKIRLMDDWFYGLPVPERRKVVDDYVTNRNRLFIVTQEKRMASELQPTVTETIFGTEKGVKEVKRETSEQRSAMQSVSESLLNNNDALRKNLLRSLDDIKDVLPSDLKNGEDNFGSSLSKSISKSPLFGSAVSKVGIGDVHDSLGGGYGFLFEESPLAEVNCKGNKKCQKKNDALKAQRLERKIKKQKQKEGRKDKLVAVLEQLKRNEIIDDVGRSCDEFQTSSEDFKDNFDMKKNSKLAQFLKETEVPQNLSSKKSNDLSSWYSEPYTQWPDGGGKPTATCVGHAIASNAMAALYKGNLLKIRAINKPEDISPDHTYSVAKYEEQRREARTEYYRNYTSRPDPFKKGYCDPENYNVSRYEGIISVTDSIAAFKSIPLCSVSPSQTIRETFKVDSFSGVEFEPEDKKPNFDVIKAMIDSGNPPIIGVDSDSRIESAGWLELTWGGAFKHPLNVVGYGEGVDPMTLCPTKYFIVRDSLGKKKIHYKVAANNLLAHMDSIYHISKIHKETGGPAEGNEKSKAVDAVR